MGFVLSRGNGRAFRVAALAGLLLLSSCNSCGDQPRKQDDGRDGLLVPPGEKQPLELSPLPQPPAVSIAPGSIAGIPAGPVTVVVARPQGEVRGRELPSITFNKPLVALGDRDATQPPPIRLEPSLPGAWRWLGSSSVDFQPAQDLPWATRFTVSVDAGLTAVDGEKLAAPYSFTFDTLRPELSGSEPRAGWRWLPPTGGKLSLFFNMPMSGELAKHVTITSAGKAVPFTVTAVVDEAAEEAKQRGARPPERSPWGQRMRYQLALGGTLAPGADVTIALDEGLTAQEGPLPAASKTIAMQVAGPMRFTAVRACPSWREDCPYGPVLLQASNEPDLETLKGKVRFEPPVVLDEEELASGVDGEEGAWALIGGRFRAGTSYRVFIDAGVKDALGDSAPAFTGELRLDDVDADVLVPASLALLEAGADDSYPIEAVNVKQVRVDIAALTPASMARLLADERTPAPAVTTTKLVETGSERNVAVRQPLPLADVFPAGAPRLFRLALSAPEVPGPARTVIGQITDLAAHAKLGATSGVVWVTSLSRGVPVAGVEVKLWSNAGKELATATSDADGVARVPGLAGLAGLEADDDDDSGGGGWWNVPSVLVSASKDGDTGVTLSTWEGEVGPSAAGMNLDWDGDATRTLGALVSERGIYRPGDEVFLKGIVRLRKRGIISVPKADSEMEILVEGGGKQVAKLRVPVSRFGTFATTVTLPASGALGWYSVSAKALDKGEPVELSTSFRVEEYRAPTFKVDVKVPVPSLIAGDAIEARVEARYLFGGAMPGAAVDVSVIRDSESFQPSTPGLERYAFGAQVWGFDDGMPASSSDVFARRRALIGADGGLDLALGSAEALAGRTTRYTVEGEVTDISRRRVANRATVMVHPASVYAGVRTSAGFGEVGKPLELELVAVSAEAATVGQRESGVPLAVVIKRREWKSIKKKDPDSGRFITLSEPEETKVSTCALTSDASAPARCQLVPEKAGLYVIEVTATDAKGRSQTTKTSSYVTGGGWVSWQRSDGELLELVADQQIYQPGQTAKVLVKSPWPDAVALVTVEREGISQVRRVALTGAASVLEVPLDDTAIPNVFVSVVVVRGRVGEDGAKGAQIREIDPGRPQVRVGYASLAVEKSKKRLAVEVNAGEGSHRPGEKLKLKLAVKDHAGQGVPAEIALWAVDEAVLRLTDYALPDIVDALHPARGLSVRLGEPLTFLVRRQGYGEKGRPPGGDGGGSGGGFRSNFKTTAFFVPATVTDAQGRAEVEVKLPDDLTTYRVMALAVTEGEQAGVGGTEIVVRKPLLVLPALPRLARVGDRFEAGVVVHADQAGDVKVSAAVEGVVLDGPSTKTVSLEAGKAREVRFTMKAAQAGRARLRFRVEGMGESDGLEQHIPVVLPTVIETVAAAGDTVDQREEGLTPPAGARADVGGLTVTLASTALAGYQDALEQLVEYPYGCAEQLSSKLVPFLAVRELEGGFGITHKDPAKDQQQVARWLGLDRGLRADALVPPDDVVKSTIRALEALQDQDGGFLYWGSSSCASPTASAYATLALFRAQELGYPVSAGVVARGQAYLSQKVAADKLPPCFGAPASAAAVDRAFAVWVLARTGKAKNSALEPLFQQRKELPLFAKAMLADAHFVGKDKSTARAQTLLQEVMNGARETAREVHFEETDPQRWSGYWSSDVRTSALVLMTLVDAQPQHPFVNKLAQYLKTARKNGRYRTTQEASFALMAVSELVRAKERDAPDFIARVGLGGTQLVEEDFRGRNLEVLVKAVPMAELLASKGGALRFSKSGEGTLSYTASLRYAQTEMPTTPIDAGIAVQRWFEPFSSVPGSGQARKVRAGELVRLRVRVATSSERRFVAIDVPLPAGLEIVDDTLASSASASRATDEGGEGGGEGGEGGEGYDEGEPYVWTPFNHTELRDDRAVLFADLLPPGVHTMTIIARATTLGSFVMQPATAVEMYAPEVSGRSDGGTFEVRGE